MLSRFILPAALALVSAIAQAQPQNILLIIADDLGADSFPLTASVGATPPPMPNISALKNSGVLFTRAYAHPTCSPSRASMLTGRHPFRTGIGAQLTDATSPQLQASEFTLPEAFAANSGLGYSLAMFGKWHLNSGAGTTDTPRTIGGWPHFAGTIIGALPDYSAWTKITNNVSAATTTYATTDIANDVSAWITARGTGTPWFAWVACNAPHAPFHLPPNDLHSYDVAAATNRNYYEAACEALDTEVGRILAGVNLATTNVIFIGDNGTPQQVIQTPYTSAHSKETLYDGGTRVPLIIAGPAVVSPNRTSTAPVQCVDLYSTILELAGISVAATQPSGQTLDSHSLLPILKNTTDATRYAFTQEFGTGLATTVSGHAIIDAAGYKLIQFDDGHEEFYKTSTDVNEATTLLGASITAADQAAYAALKVQSPGFTTTGTAPSDALLHTWFTTNSGEYARLYKTTADMNAQTSSTTWSQGTGVQSSPTYAGVHQIDYSSSWVYVRSTGLGSHIMGPWYLNATKTTLFPNYPSNTAAIYRFPRTPTIPTTKTLFGGGTVGYFVDGISMFDIRDAFYWNGTADASGTGFWNRDAFVNEGVTFDNAGAHQAGNNHHYHASPKGLRYLLGDHVDYNAATNVYTESATTPQHSPIVAWVRDGLPIYGPYGYDNPLDATSTVRRMISGFVLRNGQNGSQNLTATGRTTIPLWASRAYNVGVNQTGPAVSGTYPLGRYLEDNDYLGDLGYTQGTHFDLNEYNVRFCKTPEFPSGTWAYFLTVATDGTPVFPYMVGRSYYGNPTGGAVTSLSEPVTTSFMGGPFVDDGLRGLGVDAGSGNVTVTWNAVEGGLYQVQASNDLSTWSTVATNVAATGDDVGALIETAAATTNSRRFYRATRTGLSTYDRLGFAGTIASAAAVTGGGPNTVTPNTGARSTAVNVVIELNPAGTPAPPPVGVAISSITAGTGITVSNIVRSSQYLITATFTIAAGATTGAHNVAVIFPGPTITLTGAFTVQ